MSLSQTSCPPGMSLSQWQIQLRAQAARKGAFVVADLPDRNVPGSFSVVNPKTRRNYRVVYHGLASSWNTCDCMDFRTNGLGTCKHIEAVAQWLKSKGRTPDTKLPRNSGIDVCYMGSRRLRLRLGSTNQEPLSMLALRYFDDDFFAVPGMITELPSFIEQAKHFDSRFYVSPDALGLILDERDSRRRRQLVAGMSDSEIGAAIKTTLYPYQLEGIRFAFGAGRSLIADEMGLGKTVQAIGTAELLKAHRMASSALIICPTSLKYQWKREIERFTGSCVTIIEGIHTRRRELYQSPAFYKIVSYHTLANDIKALDALHCDILIMDEVQRLKNWNAQISQAARRVDSDYVVALSGTPLDRKPDELYSVMQFVDQYALGPYHEFVADGSRDELGRRLAGCMIRRLRSDVASQLPARADQALLVPMTKEQQTIYDECESLVAQLTMKWRRYRFLSEKDRKRLLVTLGQTRMVCDSTYILDQRSRSDTKVAEAVQLVKDAIDNGNGKVVIFSQWERMTRIIAEELDHEGLRYEYLCGGVQASKRALMAERFATDPSVPVLLVTDSGGAGLGLRGAAVIINIDMPWDLSAFGQRMAHIDRIGRHGQVQVINLVAAGTIEERMLSASNFKSGLSAGALDGDDQITIDDARLTMLTDVLAELLDTEPSSGSLSADAAVGRLGESAGALIDGLAQALSAPGGVDALADSLVRTDSEGRTTLQIPVESAESVKTVLAALARLLTRR